MALLIDEDWSKVNPVAAKQVGYTGVIGYVSQNTTGKNWTAGTLTAARNAGLDVGVVYEYDTTSARKGYAQGVVDANIAIPLMLSLHFPPGVCCYAAADWNVQPGEEGQVHEYALAFQQACHSNGYRAGVYGSYSVCVALKQAGYTGLLWQTYAWSGGKWAPGVSVRQVRNGIHVAGATVDQDTSQTVDWGQWSADGRYPQRTDGGEVSVKTDNIVSAWSEGVPSTVDEAGTPISVEPVLWRQRDEAWQKTITATLSNLTTVLASLTAGAGGLSDQAQADLHTIAEDLRKLAS